MQKKKKITIGILTLFAVVQHATAHESVKDSVNIPQVVVTGTKNEADLRLLPMTVSVIQREQIEGRYEQTGRAHV